MTELWVIVPAFNEAGAIEDTLASLVAQTDRDFTLVVVDNASTDTTGDLARTFGATAPFPVHVIVEPEKGVGSAVDTGFRYAIERGASQLARTDADCLPHPGWVAAARAALDAGAGMVYGSLRARRDENGVLGRAAFRVMVGIASCAGPLRPTSRARRGYLAPYRMHAGNNMAITAKVYLASGGMPRQPWPTDRPFFNRVRRHTAVIVRERRMVVENSTRRIKAYGVVGTALWYLDRGSRGYSEDPR